MIPAPPEGASVLFNPPPGWAAPAGFDPRRGHLVDPAWPSAPEGWAFWLPDASAGREHAALPSTTLRPTQAEARSVRLRNRLIVVGAVVVVVGIGLAAWAGLASSSNQPGAGSCWGGSSEWLHEVPCSSAEADYVAVGRTASPDECPYTSDTYLDLGDAILCLEPN
ncbi:hypothetical protein OEB99_02260 [Actinotalea sp. M2MS4P-6]|uniref:hypothetical protein n=1 Tax=Actinotalea sp. M2MS4P-6 TaxID=2983762 RepID=UPI0021E3B317|nr:hypothetical protein [Actinotalea sp. M2MS4P-6]MCV2393122.1 hypothetical protein [Actinotalea sp. M2MS4P-6]